MSKTNQEAAVVSTAPTDAVTPLDTFTRGLSDGYANIVNQIKALKENITTAPAVYEADMPN